MSRLQEYYEQLHGILTQENQEEKFCYCIRKVMQEIIDEIPPNTRIGIRPWGTFTSQLLEWVDFKDKEIVGIFDKMKINAKINNINTYPADMMENFGLDIILVTSFNRHREICESLYGHTEANVIDFCERLESKGLILRAPFYRYEQGGHEILNHFYNEYFENGSKDDKRLLELLIAAVEAKDFAMVLELCQQRQKQKNVPGWVSQVEEKTQEMLAYIKKALEERQQKDVWVFWTDAVSYDNLKYLPQVQALSKESVLFERTYTNTPFTHQTERAMLAGILPIDDFEASQKRIGREESPLIRYLEKKGYQFKIIGCEGARSLSVKDEFLINFYSGISCNSILWRSLLEMLDSREPVFYILHFLTETHEPFISADLKSFSYDIKQMDLKYQMTTAYRYIDKRLMFYQELLGSSIISVYLSDHGSHRVPNQNYWAEEKLHAYCFVWGKKNKDGQILTSKRVKRFFPYKNFFMLVQWILEDEQYSLDRALEDYIVFQDVDIYSEYLADLFIARGIPEHAISYRGAESYQYKYVINGVGREFVYKLTEKGEERILFEDTEELKKLREVAGTNFLDINKYPKFHYAKKLYLEVLKKDN